MAFKWVESLIIKNLKKQIEKLKRGYQNLFDKHPPSAPLVLCFAVTGHRFEPDNLKIANVQLHNIANRINHLMTYETLDWKVVFQDQPLGLPE